MATTPPEYVVQHVRDALATDPDVAELGVSVEIVGGDLYLRGVVATETRRAAIADIASRAASGLTVHNETVVEEIHEPAQPENLD